MLAQQCIIYETVRAMARLSVVTTLYQSESYIDEFYLRTLSTLLRITNDYEIIFVNDGSTDNSLNRAVRIIDRDDKVSVIELSRNFGHHQAMLAGLEHASGDYIWLIDSDLEESPEWLSEFYDEIIADNRLDVIYGVQRKRKGDLKFCRNNNITSRLTSSFQIPEMLLPLVDVLRLFKALLNILNVLHLYLD